MPVPEERVAELIAEVGKAASATAVVQIVRKTFERSWDLGWGSEALLAIAKRSTAATRKEWAKDQWVMALGEALKRELAARGTPASEAEKVEAEARLLQGRPLEARLVALEALRRMGFQTAAAQKDTVEAILSGLASMSFKAPARALTRLIWLAAPLAAPAELRQCQRALTALRPRLRDQLTAPDLVTLLVGMRLGSVRFLHRGARALSKDGGLVASGVELPEGRGVQLSFDLTPAAGAAASRTGVLHVDALAVGTNELQLDAAGSLVGARWPQAALFFAAGGTRLVLTEGGLPTEEDEKEPSAEGDADGEATGGAEPPPGVDPGSFKVIKLAEVQIKAILGKGGKTIQDIRSQSGAKITVDHEPNRPTGAVTIIGDIARAERMIREVLKKKVPQNQVAQPRSLVPAGTTSSITLRITDEALSVRIDGKEVLTRTRSSKGLPARGLLRLRATPDATAAPVADATVANLSHRPNGDTALGDRLLLDRVAKKMLDDKMYQKLRPSDMTEVAEAFAELGFSKEDSLRALGQEMLQKRTEFTPAELWRAQVAFQRADMPLDDVWATLGLKRKRGDGGILTTQAFAPQERHEKLPRGERREVERVSPGRSYRLR